MRRSVDEDEDGLPECRGEMAQEREGQGRREDAGSEVGKASGED